MEESKDSTTNYPMAPTLAAAWEHGDDTAIQHMTRIPSQHVLEWRVGTRRSPWDAIITITKTLQARGNPNALAPTLEMNRKLGLVSYPIGATDGADGHLSKVLAEVSDVLEERQRASSDDHWEPAEHRALARQYDELLSAAAAARDAELATAAEKERRAAASPAVRRIS